MCVRPGVPLAFQFQTGAIKSRQFHLRTLGFCRFNSKLVRLKAPTDSKLAATILERFNSKLVRLKGEAVAGRFDYLFSFNSKLVRLKVPNGTFQFHVDTRFNSKLVRLKAYSVSSSQESVCSFNSKLVRLKARSVSDISTAAAVSIPNWCD